MNKKYIKYGAISLVAIVLIYLFTGSGSDKDQISAKVIKGTFYNEVTSSGELMASSSEEITGPGDGMRSIGIWTVNITDLIDEGTYVDSGEYVATLDRDQVGTTLKDNEIEIQKAQSVYLQTKLDTSLKLREERNELVNLQFAMDEAKLVVEGSLYEAPSVKRKNEIAYEQAKLKYEQTKENFILKERQGEAKMQEAQATLSKVEERQAKIQSIMDRFVIYAPKSGILIYSRSWDGKKIVVGSRVNAWNPAVAELPNLESMKSRVYVNEVDIGKIKKGQKVEIGLDGMSDISLTGDIEYVATVGEQLSNMSMKVFEVVVTVNETDSSLLPGMSTSNRIIVESIEDVLMIPIECVFTEDEEDFVFVNTAYSYSKQKVELGPSNLNFVIVESGLEEGDEVLFSDPELNTEKD